MIIAFACRYSLSANLCGDNDVSKFGKCYAVFFCVLLPACKSLMRN